MVQMRTSLTALSLLFFLLFSSAILVHSGPAAAGVDAETQAGESDVWQRKLWMNHGSFRGPRKHLINPTTEHPLEVPELPI
ncbi:hypothetical protein NMG60_11027648 [Bertholletia excelsa]